MEGQKVRVVAVVARTASRTGPEGSGVWGSIFQRKAGRNPSCGIGLVLAPAVSRE